jgi:Ca2+-binding RTX toxin-like protein
MTYVLEGPKWGSSVRGTTATITWSFADLNLTSTLGETYGGYPSIAGAISADFRNSVRGAFSLWGAVSGLTFVENSDSALNNIRIGQGYIDGGGPVVGEASYWASGSTFRTAAIEFDTDAFQDIGSFYAVALHEIGHTIGLGHSSSPNDVMYAYLSAQNQAGLSIDDMTGIRVLYTSGLTLQGTSINDMLTGADGDDLIFGKEGADNIDAGAGNNTIVGGVDSNDGADVITAGTGNDFIYGNGGNDGITSGGGNDTVVGGFGADILLSNMGNDFIYGNQGSDIIFGGFGDDTLIGGMGADTLYGNEGNDIIYGNEGADRLIFGINSGRDVVNGFASSEGDRLDLMGQTYTLMQDLSGNAVLTLSGGSIITLAGVATNQVGASSLA